LKVLPQIKTSHLPLNNP